MYHETTKILHKKLAWECNNMTANLNDKDLKAFNISIHAMKSSMATIGAMELSEAAFKLETASKNGDLDYCLEQFPNLKEKLLSLRQRLSVLFPETVTEKKPGEADYLRENVQKALEACKSLDSEEGAEALNDLRAYDFGEETNGLLEEASAALEDFKFGETLRILNQIRL
jgi:HPt (histidine-containing phosphotransfer) domain-containing protein